MQRIRYKKDPNGTLKTKIFNLPNGTDIIITIELDGTVKYHELGMWYTLAKGPMTLNAAKKAAKQSLIAMGLTFEDEVRPNLKNPTNATKKEVLKLYQDSITEDTEQ